MDETLLDRLRKGDRAAQTAFWRSQWEPMVRLCRRILQREADAHDVAISVMADFLLTYVHQLSDGRAALSYLQLMGVRRSIRARERSQREEPQAEPAEDAAPDGSEQLEAALIRKHLQGCLGKMTTKVQHVLQLRFGGGLTNEAIGDVVGGSKQYIGRLITQSLETLRRCLSHATGVAPAKIFSAPMTPSGGAP